MSRRAFMDACVAYEGFDSMKRMLVPRSCLNCVRLDGCVYAADALNERVDEKWLEELDEGMQDEQ
jgi:hypothetical protein